MQKVMATIFKKVMTSDKKKASCMSIPVLFYFGACLHLYTFFKTQLFNAIYMEAGQRDNVQKTK
jgi:hypothetical protein